MKNMKNMKKKTLKGSFSKIILTPWQPMKCSLGSVLRFLGCFFLNNFSILVSCKKKNCKIYRNSKTADVSHLLYFVHLADNAMDLLLQQMIIVSRKQKTNFLGFHKKQLQLIDMNACWYHTNNWDMNCRPKRKENVFDK